MAATLHRSSEGEVVVLAIEGYCDEDSGRLIRERIEQELRDGQCRFVLDFAQCPLINSPAIGALVEASLTVHDDFKGRIVLCGLDPLKQKVFRLAQITPTCAEARTREEALHLAAR